jgi:MtN3 and saliva related transmembrane protein
MDPVQAIGLAAGFCTTLAFVPQVVRVWRRRSAADISFAGFAFFCFGVALWLVYGLFLGAVPIIAANGLTLLLALGILVGKLRFDRPR